MELDAMLYSQFLFCEMQLKEVLLPLISGVYCTTTRTGSVLYYIEIILNIQIWGFSRFVSTAWRYCMALRSCCGWFTDHRRKSEVSKLIRAIDLWLNLLCYYQVASWLQPPSGNEESILWTETGEWGHRESSRFEKVKVCETQLSHCMGWKLWMV